MSFRRLLIGLGLIFMISCGSPAAPATSQPTTVAAATKSLEAPATTKPAAPTTQATQPATTQPSVAPVTPTSDTQPITDTQATVAPDATAAPTGDGVSVETTGFAQNGKELTFAFTYSNPSDQAIEGTDYQVTFYDADGKVLKTDTGSIALIYPKQKAGYASSMYADTETAVAKVEIQLTQGKPRSVTEAVPEFTSDKIVYQKDSVFESVVALIHNPFDKDITNLYVSAIAYDEAGKIIGGGYTFVDFILANQPAAAKMIVAT